MTAGPNWAQRYGPNHRRICARPGCGAPAAATLRFQPIQREAWLVDLDDDAVRTEGDLCARHAAGLVLPRGWQLHNDMAAQRTETSKPAPPARPKRSASIERARRRRSATSAVELPGLSAVTDPVPDAPVVEAVEAVEAPPEPEPEVVVALAPEVVAPEAEIVVAPEPAPLVAPATPEVTEELAETLDAQTPLLKRAFRNAWLPDNDA